MRCCLVPFGALAWVPALLTVLVGCAGGRVEIRDGVVSAHDATYGYGPISPRWEPLTIANNDAAWFDPDTDGIVHVDHTCERSQDTPLVALVAHLLIGFTDRDVSTEETVPFDHREARHVVIHARLDGVSRAIELWVLKKDGCVYDLGYVAPSDRFEQGRAAFGAFVQGFHTLSTLQGPL